jgi:hypothetical protein
MSERINIEEMITRAVVDARVTWGWTFGKKPKVMAIDELITAAVLATLKEAGFVIVPAEPTAEMANAGDRIMPGFIDDSTSYARWAWREMITAAQGHQQDA